jgi:dephospho-CoA kinase
MLRIGLTGSIGMGKTTTAGLFRSRGVPVHDSDAAVHEIYRGAAVPRIAEAFPGAVINGLVDRQVLAQRVLGNPVALNRLEQIVHPMVADHRADFIRKAENAGAAMVVLDIPLLFESGLTDSVDLIVVVTAPPEVQRARVLLRPGMTTEKFEAIRARQLPDGEKRRRAHAVIETHRGIDYADGQVEAFIRSLAR